MQTESMVAIVSAAASAIATIVNAIMIYKSRQVQSKSAIARAIDEVATAAERSVELMKNRLDDEIERRKKLERIIEQQGIAITSLGNQVKKNNTLTAKNRMETNDGN